MDDPLSLPDDLPVPVDDGAADHLPGLELPALVLPATSGSSLDLAAAARGTLVLFVYPRTGAPGEESPAGWDAVPGARGCTPQACAFRDRHAELAAEGGLVAGLSAQTHEDQLEAAGRLALPYPLLADPRLELAGALSLPTFEIAGMRLYKRLTVIARDGLVAKVFYPVFPPTANADDVLAWLRANPRPAPARTAG